MIAGDAICTQTNRCSPFRERLSVEVTQRREGRPRAVRRFIGRLDQTGANGTFLKLGLMTDQGPEALFHICRERNGLRLTAQQRNPVEPARAVQHDLLSVRREIKTRDGVARQRGKQGIRIEGGQFGDLACRQVEAAQPGAGAAPFRENELLSVRRKGGPETCEDHALEFRRRKDRLHCSGQRVQLRNLPAGHLVKRRVAGQTGEVDGASVDAEPGAQRVGGMFARGIGHRRPQHLPHVAYYRFEAPELVGIPVCPIPAHQNALSVRRPFGRREGRIVIVVRDLTRVAPVSIHEPEVFGAGPVAQEQD